MKKLRRIVLVLLLLVIVGVGGLYFYRNSLIRSAVESQANSSLGVKTTLGSANLGLFGGTLALDDLKIGSPSGFTADQMFTLGELGLGVNYGDLRKAPIHVSKITIEKPNVTIEMVGGKFNFHALMNQMNSSAPPATKDGKPVEPVKLIIDELTLKDAVVHFKATDMLPKEITVNIPLVTIHNIGNADGAQDGAAIKDIVVAMMSGLAASASNSDLLKNFGGFDKILGAQANQVMGQISKQVGKITGQLDQMIGGSAGDSINKALQGVTGGNDPGKAVSDGLGGLLNGGKKDKDKDKKK